MGNYILKGLVLLFFVILLAVMSLLFFLQFKPLQKYAARRAISYVTEKTNLSAEFSEIELKPFYGLCIKGLVIYDRGLQVLALQKLNLSYKLSWRRPFIIPTKIEVDRPLIVGEIDENNKIINFPSLPQSNRSKTEKPLFEFPSPVIEVADGRIVVVKDGHIILSLSNVSAFIKISVESRENTLSAFRISVSDGSFYMEKPLLEALKWNGVVTVSRDGIHLKQLAVFSKYWSILTGSGFWGLREERGFFRFSMENLSLSAMALMPSNLKKYFGLTSVEARFTLTPHSVDMDYLISDSGFGRIKGTTLVDLSSDKKFKITNRSFLDISYSLNNGIKSHFKLVGAIRGDLSVDSQNRVFSTGELSLKSFQLATEEVRPLVFDHGDLKWRLNQKELDIEKIHLEGQYGRFKARASLKWMNGMEALLDWKIAKSERIDFSQQNKGETLNNIISKIFLMPVSESSGTIQIYCRDLFCGNINSIGIEGRASFFSPRTFISLEGNKSKPGDFRLHCRGRIERLSEWITFLDLPLSADGVLNFKAILNGSGLKENIQFDVGASLQNGFIENFTLVSFSFESSGLIAPCTSSMKSKGNECKGMKLGKFIYELDHRNKITFNGLRKEGWDRSFSGTVAVSHSGARLNIDGTLKSSDAVLSGKLRAVASSIWDRPSFSVQESIFNVPYAGRLALSLDGTASDGVISVDRFTVSQGRQVLSGRLRIGKHREINGRITAVNIGVLKRFLESKGIEVEGGSINGDIYIGGALEKPVLKLSFLAEAGEFNLRQEKTESSLKWDKIKLVAEIDRENLSGDILLESPKMRRPLEAKVMLPLKVSLNPPEFQVYKNRPFSAKISVADLDLGYVVPMFFNVKKVSGTFDADIRFYGTLADLESEGEGSIEKGEVEIKRDFIFSNIKGSLKFEPKGIRISALTLRTFEGEALIQGFIPYINWRDLEISCEVKNIVVPRFYGVTGKGSGHATLKIDQGFPLIEGVFKAEEASMNLSMLKDEIRKKIEVVSDYTESRSLGRSNKSISDFALKLLIDITDAKARVVGFGLYDEVHGKLWLVKPIGDKLKLEGKIEHSRGWYEFNETRVEISEGYALFKGSPDPDLFLVATKNVRDIEITVHVMGKGSEPEIIMSSVPPLDKIDIISYLLFNRSATSLTGRESLALQTQAATFLGSQASRILKKSIGNTPFTPDVIQLRESDSGQSSVIEIGKYLTPDFYVTYEKDLRSSGSDNVKIEYRLNRHLSIQTQLGGQNQSGMDLLWRYDFGR